MATTKVSRPSSRERRGATSALNAPRRRGLGGRAPGRELAARCRPGGDHLAGAHRPHLWRLGPDPGSTRPLITGPPVLVFARLVLVVGGTIVLICGLILVALGLVAGAWIRSLLPEVVIDARAVGGAAFALGVFLAVAGAAQLVIAAAVRRAGRWVMAGAAALAGILCRLLVACAVAAV